MPTHRGSLPRRAAREEQAQGRQPRTPAHARSGSARLAPRVPREKLLRAGFKPAGFWPGSALALLRDHGALPQPCPAPAASVRAAAWRFPPSTQRGLPRCCLQSAA